MTPTDAARKLNALCRADPSLGRKIQDATGRSRAALSLWRLERRIPRPDVRIAIARLTAGKIPAKSWLSEIERRAL